MNSIIKEINITTNSPKILIPISDVHVGHSDHDKKLFIDTVNWIKKKKAYVILLGDLVDGIGLKDRRFENSSIADEFKPYFENLHYRQTEVFLENIMPIKNQILGVMGGNHELYVRKAFSYDATSVIAQKLGVPILTDPGYLILRFRNAGSIISYNIFCSHGMFLGGRKRGAKVNNMEDKASDFEFDMMLAGHTHDKFTTVRKRITVSKGGNIKQVKKYFINTGSFLSTYTNGDHDGWASRSVFSPVKSGVVRIDFYLKRDEFDTRYIDCHTRI